MLSRLYFGVHYPTDVLVGATMGALFAIFWEFIYQKAEDKKYLACAVFAVISIVFAILCPTKSMVEMCALCVGGAIALPIENKYVDLQNATGIAGVTGVGRASAPLKLPKTTGAGTSSIAKSVVKSVKDKK